MLTKVPKHSKNKLQAKKQTWGVGCLPLSYTFLSYCNGLLKILQRVQICSVRCSARSKKLSASPPDQGLTPDSGPCWVLCLQTTVIGSRSTHTPCAPIKLPIAPLVPVLWRRRWVIAIGAIRKIGRGFLFAFYSNYGRICSRL